MTDNARVGLVVVNPERRYIFGNAAYAEILGLPISDILGRRVPEVLAAVYEEQIRPRLDRAFAGERVSYELRKLTPEAELYYAVTCEPAKVGDSVSDVVVVVMDITERKQAEAALRESEERTARIVASAMDAIISVDSQQRVILFNAAAEKMFGHRAADVLGQPLDRFIPQRFRAHHHHHIEAFAATGVTTRTMGALGQISGVRANGEEFPIEASISQISVGAQKLFTVILRDITERKQTESALRESEARHRTILQTTMDGFWLVGLIPARRSEK